MTIPLSLAAFTIAFLFAIFLRARPEPPEIDLRDSTPVDLRSFELEDNGL